MSLIAEFTIPAEVFALEHTFDEVPGLTLEIERLATHSREWIMPFVWATDGDIDSVEQALADDPSVHEYERMNTANDVGEFNVEWQDDVERLIDQIVDQHGIMQEAEAADGTWYLKLKFVDREALDEFQSYFREQGYEFELQRLYDRTNPKEREYDLTPEQRETLLVAHEMGYFSIPRDTQIQELADALGISTNAVSQRLRRAVENLTTNTLLVAPPAVGRTDRD